MDRYVHGPDYFRVRTTRFSRREVKDEVDKDLGYGDRSGQRQEREYQQCRRSNL